MVPSGPGAALPVYHCLRHLERRIIIRCSSSSNFHPPPFNTSKKNLHFSPHHSINIPSYSIIFHHIPSYSIILTPSHKIIIIYIFNKISTNYYSSHQLSHPIHPIHHNFLYTHDSSDTKVV